MNQEKEQKMEEARQLVRAYMEKTGKKQAATAREIGISGATLSLYLKDRYTGNNEEIAESIYQFLKMQKKKEALSRKPETCFELHNTKEILEKVSIAQATSDILLIFGDAGCGKTTALQYYSQNCRNVIYIEADVTNSSYRSILTLIAGEIGENEQGATSQIMRRIVAKLKGTSSLLIIDEAQHLAPKAFDAIRALNDKADIGIVYAGNPSIKKRMYGTKQDDFDQVYSRIGYHCPLFNRYTQDDINAIFRNYHLNKDCLTYLRKVAQRKGGMRVMIKQYCMAANIAVSLGEEFDTIHLEEAAERMGIMERE